MREHDKGSGTRMRALDLGSRRSMRARRRAFIRWAESLTPEDIQAMPPEMLDLITDVADGFGLSAP